MDLSNIKFSLAQVPMSVSELPAPENEKYFYGIYSYFYSSKNTFMEDMILIKSSRDFSPTSTDSPWLPQAPANTVVVGTEVNYVSHENSPY